MACCNKRRKVIEARRRILQQNDRKNYNIIQDKNPVLLNDKLLLDYHKKTHMIYAGAVTRKPVNKPFINSVINLHDKFIEETLNRGIKHNTPLKKI